MNQETNECKFLCYIYLSEEGGGVNDSMQMQVCNEMCMYAYMHLSPLNTIFLFFNRKEIKIKIEIITKVNDQKKMNCMRSRCVRA